MKRLLCISGIAFTLAVSALPLHAADFSSWGRKAQIQFSGYTKPDPLTNFPALVILNTNIGGFSYAQFLGTNADLRFTDATKTNELAYEIEKWDPAGNSYVWVQVPLLTNNAAIWTFWGKATNAPAYATDGATWTNAYAGVWHLGDTNGAALDATSNRNNGALSASGVTRGMTGTVDGAYAFSGSLSSLDCGTNASLNVGYASWEAWVYPTNITATYDNVIGKGYNLAYWFGITKDAPAGRIRLHCGGGAGSAPAHDSSRTVPTNVWTHIMSTWDGQYVRHFINGVLDTNIAESTAAKYNATTNAHIGADFNNGNNGALGFYFPGQLDEIRVSNIPRGSNWVWATCMTVASNSLFTTYRAASAVAAADLRTDPPTNVTSTSACLNGYLADAGSTDTTVLVYWGATDGGTNAANWATNAVFAAPATVGPVSTSVTVTAGGEWFYRFAGSNSALLAWATNSQYFLTTNVTVSVLQDTVGERSEPAVFTFSRPAAATSGPLTVYFTVGGTASNGIDYSAITRSNVLIEAGAAVATVQITTVWDAIADSNETLSLTVTNGPYALAGASSATVTITDVLPPNVWTASGTNDWANGTNWSAGVPQAGADLLITNANATVLLSNSPPALTSVTISNTATLTFTNWTTTLTATTIRVYGTITHVPNSAITTNAAGQWVPDARVSLVCSNLTVAPAGSITASAKGYKGAGVGGSTKTVGCGPGGGGSFTGGGYGGIGGYRWQRNNTAIYGLTNAPTDPGSGGGVETASTQSGAAGGGAIRIQASGTVSNDGLISADGQNSPNIANAGGGSGGSIYLTCAALAGQGTNTASGGSVALFQFTGGGGGGRIAIESGDPSAWNGTIRVAGGVGRFDSGEHGQKGTLYATDNRILRATMNNQSFRLSGVSAWSPASLSLSNCVLGFEEPGFVLVVTNDLNCATSSVLLNYEGPVIGTANLQVGGNMSLGQNSTLCLGRSGSTNKVNLTVGGHLTVTNASQVWLWAGTTNGASETAGGQVTVTRDFSVAGNSSVYVTSHPTNGGSFLFSMSNLLIAAGSTIDASGRGYAGGVSSHGYGPGRGQNGVSAGGYGGKGNGAATVSGTNYGWTYGSSNAPVDPGSGGGGAGGAGGGLVRMQITNTATIAGSILANGASGTYGGSGGGIWLSAQALSIASGTLRAEGGTGTSKGGGGGRIALTGWTSDLGGGTLSVAPGGPGAAQGETGTIVRLSAGGLQSLTVEGSPQRHGTPAPYGYGTALVPGGTVVTNSVALTADETNGLRYISCGWQLADASGVIASDTTTQAVVTVNTNLTLSWVWTNQYYLSTVALTNGALSPNRTGWYTNGVTVRITAVPDGGYEFLQWSGPGVPAGQNLVNPLDVTMDGARTLQAVFVVSNSAITRVWTGSGDWFSATNWNPAGIPGSGDSALLQSGNCLLSSPTRLVNLIVSNTATLTMSTTNAPLTAATVTVLGGGTVTHLPNTDIAAPWVMDHCIRIVCTNLTVAAGGSITADGKGYRGGGVGGSLTNSGCGPGYGGAFTGGGYGGNGGYRWQRNGGGAYGLTNAPADPGSGGGVDLPATQAGGAGGGVIDIHASGVVSNDGLISANGDNAPNVANCGGGSGGTILIACASLAGRGTNMTTGGAVAGFQYTGGGGGGRIAIQSGDLSAWNGTIRTAGGLGRFDAGDGLDGQHGTLYITDSRLLRPAMSNQVFRLSGIPSWAPSSLSLSNCILGFEEPGFQLFVTNDLNCTTSSVLLNYEGPSLGPAVLQVGGAVQMSRGSTLRLGRDGDTNRVDLQVGSSLSLSNNCQIWLYSGVTNASLTPSGGVMRVTQDVTLLSNSTLYVYSHPTNGGSVFVSVGGTLTVGTGCAVSAASAGFGGGYKARGFGPGGGFTSHPGGGGYGGHGGYVIGQCQPGGPTYGNSNAPAMPGSGGGGSTAGAYTGARGGGLLWLSVAGDVVLNGSLNANGGDGAAYNGGGSGGGIYLTCRKLLGLGTLTANGGIGGTTAGKGGGGRIAVWSFSTNGFTGTASATKGAGTAGDTDATDGTIVWGMRAPPGSVFTFR